MMTDEEKVSLRERMDRLIEEMAEMELEVDELIKD